jgi:hypothetical protein
MLKFGAYPIKVNYNLHTRLRNKNQEDEFHQAGQYLEERKLDMKVNTSSDATIENNMYRQELNDYEQAVCSLLRKIDGNRVGRMVLGHINKKTTVWIVPKSDEELKHDNSAQTHPLNYDIQTNGMYVRGYGSGDTVILYNPELGDGVLLHELVHAYRYSFDKFVPVNLDYSNGYSRYTTTSEEILAHVIQNIYLSEAKQSLCLDYKSYWDGSTKEETYKVLVGNERLMWILNYFLRHEYLATMAAHTFKTTEYNPFRDFATLEAASLKTRPLVPASEEPMTVAP